MINTARLLVRISKYCASTAGGKAQTGETKFGRDCLNDPTFLRRWRSGVVPREASLERIDKFLTARGY